MGSQQLAAALQERIEALGYQVRGYHDSLGEGTAGAVVIVATDQKTGKTVRVRREDGDEYCALVELADLVGLPC